MITPTLGRRVFAYAAPVDMRKGYDGLYGLVSNDLSLDPLSGDLYLFVSRNRIRAKVLMWDGTGLCIFSKRLERGRFVALWGSGQGETLSLSSTELALYLEGCSMVGRMPLSPPPMTRKDFYPAEKSCKIRV